MRDQVVPLALHESFVSELELHWQEPSSILSPAQYIFDLEIPQAIDRSPESIERTHLMRTAQEFLTPSTQQQLRRAYLAPVHAFVSPNLQATANIALRQTQSLDQFSRAAVDQWNAHL